MAGGSMSSGPGSSHPVKIFANIFIAFIGAGVLGLPYAFKEAGILEGIFIMTFVAVASTKAMLLIIDCKYKILGKKVKGIPSGMTLDMMETNDYEVLIHPPQGTSNNHDEFTRQEEDLMISVKEPRPGPKQDISYGDVGFHAIGHTGRVLVDIAIVVSQTGFCCAYIIFISENLSDYIKGVRIGEWLVILLPPLFLLTLLRHLSSLAASSLLAQLSNLMAFGVVFWFDFEHLFKITLHPKEMSVKGFPFFLAIAIYCYEGAGMILALETSLAEDIRHKFKKFLVTTLTVVTTLYITFGTCGYLSFGPETKSIITLNLPKGSGVDFGLMVKLCLCTGIFFTYPVMMFPVVKLLENYFLPDAGKSVWKGNCLRCGLVVLTGFVVLAVPDFANLMALVGASCCTLLAFILPGIFHYNIFKGSLSRSQILLDCFLVFVGVCGTIVGTMDALKRMSETPESTAVVDDFLGGGGGGGSTTSIGILTSSSTMASDLGHILSHGNSTSTLLNASTLAVSGHRVTADTSSNVTLLTGVLETNDTILNSMGHLVHRFMGRGSGEEVEGAGAKHPLVNDSLTSSDVLHNPAVPVH